MPEITPYLCVVDAHAAIKWSVATLGAEVTHDPIVMPDGRIGHVEIAVGGARWMMIDEFISAGVAAADPARGAAVTLHLEVDDCDAVAARVAAAGTATAAPRTHRLLAGSRSFATPSGTAGSSAPRLGRTRTARRAQAIAAWPMNRYTRTSAMTARGSLMLGRFT